MLSQRIIHYSSKVQEDLSKSFTSGLFPRWTLILATILSLLILMLVMTKLFYNPVKKMVEKRRKFIQTNIDESIRQNVLASSDREKANQELVDANLVALNIISDAKFKAEKIREANISKAKDEANSIVLQAHKEAAREKKLLEMQAKEEMIQLAIVLAKKVVEKEVNTKTNRKFIRDFVKKQAKQEED